MEDWDDPQAHKMPHRRRACCDACHCSAGACLSRRRWWLWRWHARRRLWSRDAWWRSWRRDACHGRRRDALRRDGRRRTLGRDGRRPAFQRSPVRRRALGGARSVRAAFLARSVRATFLARRLPARLPPRLRPSWLRPSPLPLPPALPSLCVLWRALLLRLRRLLRRLLAPGVDRQWSAVGQRLLRIRLLNAGEPTSL